MGMGRLMMALDLEKIELPIDDTIDAFVMYVNDEEKLYAINLTQDLRMQGFKVETEYLGRGLKGQFKQADRLHAKFLVILNSDDIASNLVNVKNNETKEEEKVDIDYLMYYLDEQLNDLEDISKLGGEIESDDENCDCNQDHCEHGHCHCGKHGSCHHEGE